MDAKRYGFSDFQWFAVLICLTLGGGIITLPRTVAEVAGRDAWLSLLIAGVFTWGLAVLIWLLCRKFPNRTLPEFCILVLGKPLGILVSVLYALYAFTAAGESLRIFVELIKTWVLIWTPASVFVLAILVTAVYINRLGATTLARLMEIITLLTVFVLLIWLVPVGEINFLNLRPVGTEGLVAIAKGGQESIFAFLGFDVMLVLFPFIRNRKNILRVTLLALTVVTLLYAGNVILTHGVLGVEHTLLQQWPLMNYLRVGSLPFIQRVDTIVLFFWTAQILAVVAIQYFAGTYILASLTRHHYHDLWSLLCWPIIYLVAIGPGTLSQVQAIGAGISRWGLVGVIGLVVLLLLVANVRRLDERREEEKE